MTDGRMSVAPRNMLLKTSLALMTVSSQLGKGLWVEGEKEEKIDSEEEQEEEEGSEGENSDKEEEEGWMAVVRILMGAGIRVLKDSEGVGGVMGQDGGSGIEMRKSKSCGVESCRLV